MAMNLDLVGRPLEPVEVSWSSKDAMLYALGVGAGGQDPLTELCFTTENTRGWDQRVLPTFVVSLIAGGELSLGDFDPARLLHGAQTVETFGDIAPGGRGVVRSRVLAIYDKGSAAVAVLEADLEDAGSGEILARTESQAFVQGEGGFGGSHGDTPAWPAPERGADQVVEYATRRDQALLFRLNGDRNPLHSDPSIATSAGFGQPILHGMATYGFAGRALLHSLCDSDPARFGRMTARFASPVRPGDTLVTHIWDDGEVCRFVSTVGETTVLDRGLFTRREP